MVTALQSVFTGSYDRDRQFIDLKISPDYPKAELDYPCIVVEFNGSGVKNSGVGHEEWFDDANGNLQKWNHRRFAGEFDLNIFALSTLDRDILADAVIEVISFGWLTSDLMPFFTTIYQGWGSTEVELLFNQLYINSDEIDEHGASVTVGPWRPEDQLVYTYGLSVACGGGFYNIVPELSWEYVEQVNIDPYPQGDVTVEIPLTVAPPATPLADVPGDITNPRQFFDDNTMPDPQFPNADPPVPNTLKGVSVISGIEDYVTTWNDQGTAFGTAVIGKGDLDDSATAISVGRPITTDEGRNLSDGATSKAVAVPSGVEEKDMFDGQTIRGEGFISSAESEIETDSGTATSVGLPSGSDSQVHNYSDSGMPVSVAKPSLTLGAWTTQTNAQGGSGQIADLAWASDRAEWFAAGQDNNTAHSLQKSPDGANWTAITNTGGTSFVSIAYSASKSTIVGATQDSGHILIASSDGGSTWSVVTPANVTQVYSVRWFDGLNKFIAWAELDSAHSFQQLVYLSSDGFTWTAGGNLPVVNGGFLTAQAIAYSPTLGTGQGMLAVAGYVNSAPGTVATSIDGGATWTLQTTPYDADNTGNAIYWWAAKGLFIWGGQYFNVSTVKTCMTSPDGVTWTAVTISYDTQYADSQNYISYFLGFPDLLLVGYQFNSGHGAGPSLLATKDGVTFTALTNNLDSNNLAGNQVLALAYSPSLNQIAAGTSSASGALTLETAPY